MANQRTPKLIGNCVRELCAMLDRVRDALDEKDSIKLRNLRGDIETLQTTVKNVGVIEYVNAAQEFAAPPLIDAGTIRRCKLCNCDHVNQPLKSYVEDGLPHPLYTHWYVCPIAEAPVGIYIAGDSDVIIDDRVIEELQKAASKGSWLVACFGHRGNTLDRYWHTNEFPREKIAGKALVEWANARKDKTDFQALDWLVEELCKSVQPPPVVKLPVATVPDTIPLFESQK